MNLPNEISGSFNRNITLGVGTLKVYKDGVLFLTFTESDITVNNNQFVIDVTNLFTDNGDYFITFTKGLFISTFGEIYDGISNSTDWAFSIVDGEYDSNDYTNDYLID